MDIDYIDEQQLLMQADRFLAKVSGVNEFGNPKASILIRIGGADTQHAQEYDLGPVEVSKKIMQGCYILNLKFEKLEQLKNFHRLMQDNALYIDALDGAVDENHIMSLIIMANDDFSFAEGYVIAQMPVLFALTGTEPGAITDSYQISFRKDTLFYFDVEAILRQDENSTDVLSEEDSLFGQGGFDSADGWGHAL